MDRAEVLNLHDDLARCILLRRIYVCELTSYHLCDDLIGRQLCRRPGSYIGTVPHDRDIVCDTLDLIHLVGYVYHCNTLITKVIHDTEECFYLIIGKRGGRLIKDHDLRLLGYRFCDLHGLHLTDGKCAELCLRIKIHLYLFQPLLRLRIHLLVVNYLKRSVILCRESSQIQVLSHASRRNRL